MATILVAATFAPVSSSAAPTTPLEALDSVFVVNTFDSRGSSFVVTESLLMTAAHVVEGTNTVRLEGTQDPPVRLDALVIYRDSAKDIAILQVEGDLKQAPLTLQTGTASVGDEVFAAGSPIDGVVLSKGKVSAVDTEEGIISSTPVDPGSSGGPLLDSTGAVVGMVYAQSIPSGAAYSVPVDALQRAIAEAQAGPTPDDAPNDQTSGITARGESLVSVAALIVSLIALALSLAAFWLILITRRRQRRTAPPITITLNEE